MSNELLASKIATRRESPKIRTIRGGPTAVLGMIGISQKGPVGQVVTITSFDEFVDVFGGDILNSDAIHAVRAFYEEGGTQLRFSRTVHYTDPDDPLTKTSAAGTVNAQTAAGAATAGTVLGTATAPFNLEPGDDLDFSVDGGGTLTATFTATSPTQTSGNTEPFALVNGDVLDVEIDGGATQNITFLTGQFVSIGAATAAEVAAVINGALVGGSAADAAGAVTITSDSRGTGAGVQVTGGTANAVGKLNFPTSLVSGTGNVVDIDAVTVAEVKTIVEAAVAGVTVTDVASAVQIETNTPGAGGSILVEATSTADDELGLDNATHVGTSGAALDTIQIDGKYDGEYSKDLTVGIADATSGEAARFNWQTLRDGVVLETFPNLTMDDADDRHVEKIVNAANGGSIWLLATDLDVVGTALNARPENGTVGPLVGGADGIIGLVDADFIGSSAGGTGLHALNLADDVTILAVPGRATNAMHNAMITYAEVFRDGIMFAVLDPPADTGAAAMVAYVRSTAALEGLTEFGAIYWPEVRVVNPERDLFGDTETIVVPPSGHIAGIMARTDASRPGGIYKQPAGVERGILRSVVGFAGDDDDGTKKDDTHDINKRDLVYPVRINPLTTGDGLPRFIDGTRTLKADGSFPSVGESRGVIYIDRTISKGIQFGRHEDNTVDDLERPLERTVSTFLRGEMIKGAFRTKDPATAFFVDFGPGLNPESVVFLNERRGRVGLATKKPADWIILAFTQDTRALEQELAG
jgi:hypothetical protein